MWAFSSVGQSSRLITGWSWVRVPEGPPLRNNLIHGKIPERPKGTDCKSVVSDFGGSNPPLPTKGVTKYGDSFFVLNLVNVFFHRYGAPFEIYDAFVDILKRAFYPTINRTFV